MKAALLPPIAALAAVAFFVIADAAGEPPLSYGRLRNIAEAAGLGTASEVIRFLDEGADPTRVLPVREVVISSTIHQISALEAAVWSRQLELVRLLDRRGVILTDERARLACLAADLEAEDIREFLVRENQPGCQQKAVQREILARPAVEIP